MSVRTFPRLWPVLGMGMLLAALAPAADPPKKDLPAPPQADKVPDGSFVPGEPRTKPLILAGGATVKGPIFQPVRLDFVDQGKALESRRDLRRTVIKQPGIIYASNDDTGYQQDRTLWDVRDGNVLEENVDKGGVWNFAAGKAAADFDLRQICRVGDVELVLRYKVARLQQPRNVVVRDPKTQKELRVVGPLSVNASSKFNATADLEFAADGTLMLEWNFANAGRALDLRFWDLKTGQPRKKWQAPVQTVWQVPARPITRSNYGGRIVGGGILSHDGTEEHEISRIAAWNSWQAKKPLYLSPDGKLVAVRDTATKITLWDVAEQKRAGDFDGYSLRGFSTDGKCLIVIQDDKKDQPGICLLDYASGKVSRVCDAAHVGYPRVGCLALSADNSRLATYRPAPTEYDNRVVKPVKAVVRIWDTATGTEVYSYDGHQAGICSLAISPQGRTVASCDWGGNIHIWEIPEKPDASMLSKKTRDNGASLAPPSAAKDDANAAARAIDANAEANAEKSATAKLVLAKQLVAGGGSKSTAMKWLEDLLARYPMTQAADEARRLLKDWRK